MSMRLTNSQDNDQPPLHRGPVVLGSGVEHVDLFQPGWSHQLSKHLNRYGLSMRSTSLGELLETPTTKSIAIAPVLVVLSEHDPDRVVGQLMDLLSYTHAPAVVITGESHARARSFMEAEGILCESINADPRDIAMMLHTLAQRQPAFQRLNTDLRLSEMTISGVQSEVAKLHEELQTAASIQREYLPDGKPDIQGVDLGIIYRPASYVSGDLYDITQLDEHRSAFFLADAVGHGVPAALMTMIISQGLRKIDGTGKGMTIVEPADALRRLNDTMSKKTSSNTSSGSRFATAMYAVYDSRTGQATIAGAGHPPALVVRAKSGQTEMIDSQGPLLGIFAGVEFGQTTITLGAGDVLVFYSDGFEVAFPSTSDNEHDRRRPTQTYLSRLRTAGNNAGKLNESIKILEDNLDLQLGSLHQPDDITALFIAPSEHRSPAADEFIRGLSEAPAHP